MVDVVSKASAVVLTCSWHYVVHENVTANPHKDLTAAWNKHL